MLNSHRDLLPYVQQRDEASISLAKQSSELQETLNNLSDVQVESLKTNRKNVDLTSELLSLAEEASRRKTIEAANPEIRREIRRIETEVKASRQKWRVMKGTVSAVVAGSGVDWVGNPELCDLVLDPEDEG